MNISTNALVSNSDMIKYYKSCREKAEEIGRIFILKNNMPDAVLFSVKEYNRLAVMIEYLQGFSEEEVNRLVHVLIENRNNTID